MFFWQLQNISYTSMNFHDYVTFIGNEEDQKISAYAYAYLNIMSLMSDLNKE